MNDPLVLYGTSRDTHPEFAPPCQLRMVCKFTPLCTSFIQADGLSIRGRCLSSFCLNTRLNIIEGLDD